MKSSVPYEVMIRANLVGLKGQKVVDWIPPQFAADNPEGFLVTMPASSKIKSAGDA